MGYQSAFQGRSNLETEGIAILYKEDKYTLLETEGIDLDDVSKSYPERSDLFLHANTAMLCLFEMKDTKSRFIAGNTHFQHHPMLDYVKYA